MQPADESAAGTRHRSTLQAQPVLGLFLAIALLMAGDIAWDAWAGTELGHLLTEGLLTIVALAGAAQAGLALHNQRAAERLALERARGEAEAAEERARRNEAEAARWREEARTALAGLGEAIDRQFQRWALTPAEAEVGLLLLKGLSTKEIASLRETSDATVRQQARALYAKAELGGRAELSAFFLEDLLLPRSQGNR